jgi:transcriptional regulator with XRE-family HTH domain
MYRLPSLLRTQRRTWGLSQREMAKLLGFESSAEISRLEHGKRTPGLETALACSTLFGVPVQELFPQLAVESVDKLRERVGALHEGLNQPSTASAARKRELLDSALSRTDDELRRGSV